MTLYSRKADQKIELLREVIQRVQNGENFDVEKLLGTGDPKMEEEWFDGTCYTRYSGRGQADRDVPSVIREIENEENVMNRNERQRLRREARRKEQKAKEEAAVEGNSDDGKVRAKRRPEFL